MLRLLIIVVLLQLSIFSFGRSFNILHWGLEDGLSNSLVVDLAYDKHGNLWIATEAGLNMFDGRRFMSYDTTNSDIAGNSLNTLLYDYNKDLLWIGTKSGLSIFDCASGTFLPTEQFDSIPMIRNIQSLAKSKDGIWIANLYGKILHYNENNNKINVYSRENVPDLPNGFLSVFDNGNGELYIGHVNDGLTVLDIKTREIRRFVSAPGSLPGNRVYSIISDNLGNIWIGTHQGLAMYNPANDSFQSFKHIPDNENSLLSDHIYMLRIFNGNELWIASDIGGVSILDLRLVAQQNIIPVKFRNLKTTYNHYGLSSKNIRSILQDKYGNIWIGNHSSGIDLICNSEPMFRTLPYFEQGTNQNPIQGIFVDKANGIWIGNENEIALFRDGQLIERHDFSKHLRRPYVRLNSIQDIDGQLLLGLYDDGMLSFNPITRRFNRLGDAFNKDVFSIYKTSEGNILVGSHGLYRYSNGKIDEVLDYDKTIGHQAIYSIIQDKTRNLWIGTYGNGIYIFDKSAKLIKHITAKEGFCSNVIHQLHADVKGGIWIATRHGLGYVKDCVKPDNFKCFTDKNGLNDIYVHALITDAVGNLWFSTNKGISRLNIRDNTFRHYDWLDGIPRGSFMDNSVTVDSSGNIYFGSQNGVCWFNPRLSEISESPSPIRILEVLSLYNEGHDYKEKQVLPDKDGVIRLPHDRNSIVISFAVSDFSQTDKVEYAYMLEGMDKTWIPVKNETSVTFRNLPSGSYTFKARARMHKQSWSDDMIAEIRIVISPSAWLSWYAIGTYFLILLGVGIILLRLYKKRLENANRVRLEQEKAQAERALNDERLRFYTNVTHELRTPLTLILGPLEDMTKDEKLPRPYDKKIKTIRDSAVKLLDLVNQLLEFRKTETQNKKLVVSKQNIARLVREISLRYQELNRNPNVEFKVDISLRNPIIYFDQEIIRTILNNLLSNAVKYTPEGSITVRLQDVSADEKEYVELSVSDTGYGIEESELSRIFERFYQTNGTHQASGTGIGLSIVKAMVELHEGTLEVKSKVGKGTLFTIRILANNTYPNSLHRETITETTPEKDREENKMYLDTDNRPLILVIEDNDDIRDYISESLSDKYRVITAVNGQKGVEMAVNEIPDVIISDIMMPVMDGMEACRILKSDMTTSHIPIILLTAKNAIEDKEKGYETGADSYLTKPFSAKLLLNRVCNILDTRSRLFDYIKKNLMDVDTSARLDQKVISPSPVLNNLDDEFISKLVLTIKENITSELLGMDFLQGKFNMSYSTLYRKVKGLTGLSANEFIQKVKLRHAAELLTRGDMNVNEVAYASGFNSLSYFSGKFKKEYEVNPSQYHDKIINS